MTDFENFLTDEDVFRLEMEKYIPEFKVRAMNRTLHTDTEFRKETDRLMELAKKAGIDMKKYVMDRVNVK